MKYLFLCLSFWMYSANATVRSFDFFQGGFDESASVAGTFAGDDLDGNGQLSSISGEITDFSMSFTGNSLVSSFSLGFPDLFGVVYDLNGGSLGDGLVLDVEGITATTGIFSYLAGPGPISFGGSVSEDFNTSLSTELVIITPTNVPIPSATWLFISGFIGLLGLRKNNIVISAKL